MRFTEHELTIAVTAAARTVAGVKGRRRASARIDADAVWESMSKLERYHHLEAVGAQVLPVLLALPDVEVAAGTRPTFTDAQVIAAVEDNVGDGGGRLRRKVAVAAQATLVKVALAQLPPRQDPDALVVPDTIPPL